MKNCEIYPKMIRISVIFVINSSFLIANHCTDSIVGIELLTYCYLISNEVGPRPKYRGLSV